MRDLVDRLRDPDHLREWGMDIDALCAEAAEEIKRLRAQLSAVRNHCARIDDVLREAAGINVPHP